MTDYNSDNDDDHTIDCEDEEEIEDDEATLDEEDALNEEDDYGNELKELQEDGELPIEELRRKYCVNEEKEEMPKTSKESEETQKNVKNAQTSSSSQQRIGSLRGKIIASIASTCDAAVNNYFKAEDLEEDESEDYLPPELWKKEIRIGPDYQVSNIPQVIQISNNDKNKPVETCEVLWIASPDCCPESVVTEYLIECEQIRAGEKPKNGVGQTPKKHCKDTSSETASTLLEEEEIVPDDENALYALYMANYNVKKAKAKAPFEWPALCSVNGPKLTQPGALRTWTEEDCENFEKGMADHGKHFLKIQRDYLPRRTMGEIVSFYYSWKKSERHNIWRQVQQSRRELQHVDVKCVDLMGQIAESILRQNQVEDEKEEKLKNNEQTKNGGVDILVENVSSSTDTSKATTSTSSE
ncbi:hypothetical protein ACQ4LE_009495 [Meloidogyne hapla]|uniref:SANT domain-containing protein n=1 Tax=Meloidogyne hapla TaxID=6305 RepID=A0A1I8BCJ3_MELHA